MRRTGGLLLTDRRPLGGRILGLVLGTVTVLVAAATVALAAGIVPSDVGPVPTGSDSHRVDFAPDGYWLVGADGGVFAFGGARFFGSMGGGHLVQPIVGMAATPDGKGYWLVASDGGVFAFGDAGFYGSMGGGHLAQPIVGMATTPDGRGYWLAAADGGVFAFGDAGFYGAMSGVPLVGPVVGIAATPTGHGYWMAATDGGVFAFGDAPFYGSTGGRVFGFGEFGYLRPGAGQTDPGPVRAIGSSLGGRGYWLVAADGGVDALGAARTHGTADGISTMGTVVSVSSTPTGSGYWMAATDGGVFAFGDAPFYGSAVPIHPQLPIVGFALAEAPAVDGSEYTITGNDPTPLFPGTSSPVDLVIANSASVPITVESDTISVTTSSPACPASNFTQVHGLTRPVTVPAHTTISLLDAGVPQSDWPVLGMFDTHTDQDSCRHVGLTLHYLGEAIG